MSRLAYEIEVEIPPTQLIEQFYAAKVALERFSETRDLVRSEWGKQFPHFKSFVSYLIDAPPRTPSIIEITSDHARRIFIIAADEMSQAVVMCAGEMVGREFISAKLIKSQGKVIETKKAAFGS